MSVGMKSKTQIFSVPAGICFSEIGQGNSSLPVEGLLKSTIMIFTNI